MDNFSGTNQTQSHQWSALQRVHRQSALAGGSQVALLTRTSYPYPKGNAGPAQRLAVPPLRPIRVRQARRIRAPAGRRRSQRLTPDE